ncbi:hypothetical protein T06_10732 [Trichinella sp. T6]|nr:hypothetical protein T06_10732 [Trichinella sp. T6]
MKCVAFKIAIFILHKHTFVDFSAWFNIKVVSKFETFPLTLYVCPIVPCKSQKHMNSLSYSYYQKVISWKGSFVMWETDHWLLLRKCLDKEVYCILQ